MCYESVLMRAWLDQEGNKLQRPKQATATKTSYSDQNKLQRPKQAIATKTSYSDQNKL